MHAYTYTVGFHDMHACMVMSYKYSYYIDSVAIYACSYMHMESTLIPHLKLAAISCNEIVNYG